MEIDVTQLQLGDEFLYSANGNIARAKVIRPVEPKKVQKSFTIQPSKLIYKSVKCKVSRKETTYVATWNNRSFTRKEYFASEDYNIEKYIDLNHKNLWLIKRNKQ